MKIKVLITDIETKKDKNQQDYWIIRTKLETQTFQPYLAFSADFNLSPKTLSLLTNYPHRLVNQMVTLTTNKKEGDILEKVIAIEMEK